MVKIAKEHWMLAIIFLLVLGARLYMVLPEKAFDYSAYDALRQAEHIRETGAPLFKDSLSYSGRTIVFPPLFYYVLAGLSFLMPLELAAKVLPSIGFASLSLIMYLIAKHLTKNRTASLLAAFFCGFVPVIYTTLNQASVYSLSLPLIFLLAYSFMRIDEKGFAALSLILAMLLLLTHAAVFILFLTIPVYFVIVRLGRQELSKKELEISFFMFFLALWFNLLLYKRAFLMHGISFIWQNIPSPLLSSYFSDISVLGITYAVGVIPLLLGVYAVYHVFFKTKSQSATLFISFALVSFIMLWLKLIPIGAGLLFLSLNLIILSSYAIKIILVSISKTKVPKLSAWLVIGLIFFFIVSTLSPFVVSTAQERDDMPSEQDISDLEWVRTNTEPDAVVLGRLEEGFMITYLAQRKNVADQNFLLIKNIDQRYEDINKIFTLRLEAEAVRLINDYHIDYIFLSRNTMRYYNITGLFYAEPRCFEIVKGPNPEGGLIYKFLDCEVA
jgi:hypothetical protein